MTISQSETHEELHAKIYSSILSYSFSSIFSVSSTSPKISVAFSFNLQRQTSVKHVTIVFISFLGLMHYEAQDISQESISKMLFSATECKLRFNLSTFFILFSYFLTVLYSLLYSTQFCLTSKRDFLNYGSNFWYGFSWSDTFV